MPEQGRVNAPIAGTQTSTDRVTCLYSCTLASVLQPKNSTGAACGFVCSPTLLPPGQQH